MARGHPLMPPQQYPSMPERTVRDEEAQFSEQFIERLVFQLSRSLESWGQYFVDKTNRVDEYQPQSTTDANSQLTSVSVQPVYECNEVIESIIVTGPATNTSTEDLYNEATATTPTAGQTIATLAANIPAGLYQVYVSLSLAGTPAQGTDNSNFELVASGAILTAVLPNTIQAGLQQFGPFYMTATGSNTFSVRAVNLATTGAIYTASITAVPVSNFGQSTPEFTLALGSHVWNNLALPASGILVVAPVAIPLSRSAPRQLTSATAGDWTLELMGYAETGRRGIV